MRFLALQEAIVAHLRSAERPESSRDLARRFLRIAQGDEETCRRLLSPFLLSVPGVAHRPGEGWLIARRPAAAPRGTPADRPGSPDTVIPEGPGEPLGDFVAVASDGGGPGGSGGIRAISLLPVVGGDPCQEEDLPAAVLDADGAVFLEGEADGPAGSGAGADRPRGIRPAERGLGRDDLQTLVEIVGDLPIVCHRISREVEPLRRACAAVGISFQPRVISAARLGHLLLGLKANHAAIDLAAALGLVARGPDDCRGRVRVVAEAYLALAALLADRGIDSLAAVLGFQEMPPAPIDLSPYAFTADDLRALPAAPGVYRLLDREGVPIYVGKSKNLRTRLASYFAPSARGTAKGRAILDQVRSFAVERTASELEATLLEAALIAEHRPRLNRQFEVHERPAPYGPRLNLAVVLADAADASGAAPSCTVHLLRGGFYAGRLRGIGRAGGDLARATVRLGQVFFSGGSGRAGTAGHDIDWQLIGSYLRKEREKVNVLDLDECASAEEAGRRLRILVEAAAGSAGRVVAR